MFRPRNVLLGVTAVLVAGAIAASAAVAAGPYWYLAGSRFEIGAPHETVIVAGATELKAVVLGLKMTVTCETATAEDGFIKPHGLEQGQDEAKSITFEKCKVPSPTGCATENVKTVPVKSHLVIYTNQAGEEKIGDLFEPTKGKEFTTFTLKNNGTEECGLAASYPVKGTTVAEVTPEGSEAATGELGFPATPITAVKREGGASEEVGLVIGSASNKASFSGQFKVKLVSGGKFGAFKT